MKMADSRPSDGESPVAWMSDCWLSVQLSLNAILFPLPSCNSRVGSWSGFGTCEPPNEGPIPRIKTSQGAALFGPARSEERRVGKEWRTQWALHEAIQKPESTAACH